MKGGNVRHSVSVGVLAAAFAGAAGAGEAPAAAGDVRARIEALAQELKGLERRVREAERALGGAQGELDAITRENQAAGAEQMLRYEFQGHKPLPPRIVQHLGLNKMEEEAVNAAFAREAESVRTFLGRETSIEGAPSLVEMMARYKAPIVKRWVESPELVERISSAVVDALMGERVACMEDLLPEDRLAGHVERLRLKTYEDLRPLLTPEVHRRLRRLFGSHYTRFGAEEVGGTPCPYIVATRDAGLGHMEQSVKDLRADLEDRERRLREARDSLSGIAEQDLQSRVMVFYTLEKPLHDRIAAYLELTPAQRAAVDAALRDEVERFRVALVDMLAREFPDDAPGRQTPLQELLATVWPRLQKKLGSHPDNAILRDLLRDPEVLSGRKTVYLDEAAPRAMHALVWGGFFRSRERTFRDLEKVLSPEQHRRLTSLIGHAFMGYRQDNYNISLRNIRAGRDVAE